MCGIVGYLGPREAYPIIINGLKRLEYRGYDSAGVALIQGDGFRVYKKQGKVSDLEGLIGSQDTGGSLGMGHTRWATHGAPSDVNSHPHASENNQFVLVHNGIIENFDALKSELIHRGYSFKSETDTEVLVNLIDDAYRAVGVPFEEAVRIALNQVVGAYAIVVMCQKDPGKVVCARKGSPLVIGVGAGEFFIASDATPFLEYTNNAVYLEEDQMAVLRLDQKMVVSRIESNQIIDPYIQELKLSLEMIEKGGYEHFMLKEIFEQPKSIRDTLRGRLLPAQGIVNMGGIKEYESKFLNAHRIIIIGCGTSWHAGLVAEYLFEDLARLPVEVEYASEFRYRNPVITENDVVIAISQSGETADTLAAIRLAKSRGATIFGVCNVVGSSIARETDAGAYTHAGPEIGVASTKAFTAQVAVLTLIALELGRKRGTLSESRFRELLWELDKVPSQIEEMLAEDDHIKKIAANYKDAQNCLYLGRGYNFPVALEGALKLKEISYIHAEGYPAAEMKHGPIALIDKDMPVIVIATRRGHYEKVVSNVQEVHARDGRILAIVNHNEKQINELAEHIIIVPDTEEAFSPLLTTIPLQLLSYHIAVMRGCNVDQPRNLAKSVTVE